MISIISSISVSTAFFSLLYEEYCSSPSNMDLLKTSAPAVVIIITIIVVCLIYVFIVCLINFIRFVVFSRRPHLGCGQMGYNADINKAT